MVYECVGCGDVEGMRRVLCVWCGCECACVVCVICGICVCGMGCGGVSICVTVCVVCDACICVFTRCEVWRLCVVCVSVRCVCVCVVCIVVGVRSVMVCGEWRLSVWCVCALCVRMCGVYCGGGTECNVLWGVD